MNNYQLTIINLFIANCSLFIDLLQLRDSAGLYHCDGVTGFALTTRAIRSNGYLYRVQLVNIFLLIDCIQRQRLIVN